ncbi:MAG TPA: hypothetical protein VKA84_04375, partial [Gemmatimonadaceae bacterium]|nr:hypothetical protein [Gemmatimonadaceae bacterium]
MIPSRSKLAHALPLLLPILLAAPATALRAQAGYAVSGFGAVNYSTQSDVTLIGLGLTTFGAPFGARLSGAIGTKGVTTATDEFEGGGAPVSTPWTLDADVLLSTTAIPALRAALGGFDVAGFAGVGAQGVRGADSGGATLVTSYGGALSRTIAGALSVDAEARYRTPV